jgi:hypothetical protein
MKSPFVQDPTSRAIGQWKEIKAIGECQECLIPQDLILQPQDQKHCPRNKSKKKKNIGPLWGRHE